MACLLKQVFISIARKKQERKKMDPLLDDHIKDLYNLASVEVIWSTSPWKKWSIQKRTVCDDDTDVIQFVSDGQWVDYQSLPGEVKRAVLQEMVDYVTTNTSWVNSP